MNREEAIKQFDEIASVFISMTTIEYNWDLYIKAFEFMFEKHRGQKRQDGSPYFVHPFEVSCSIPNADIKTKIVALLHDTLEDTDTTIKELHTLFGFQIGIAVIRLTKYNDENYENYINQIKQYNDPLATAVKIADLKHNLSTIDNIVDIEKRNKLKDRYIKALTVLEVR